MTVSPCHRVKDDLPRSLDDVRPLTRQVQQGATPTPRGIGNLELEVPDLCEHHVPSHPVVRQGERVQGLLVGREGDIVFDVIIQVKAGNVYVLREMYKKNS